MTIQAHLTSTSSPHLQPGLTMPTQTRDVLSGWLQRFYWQWFCTLTFEHPQSTQSAVSHLEAYYSRLKKVAYRKPAMFWVTERGSEGNRLHIHALIHAQDTHKETISGLWICGKAKVLPFTIHAAPYCSKDLDMPDSEWRLFGTPKEFKGIPLETVQ